MRRDEQIHLILRTCRPKTRKGSYSSFMFGFVTGGKKKNKQKSIYERTLTGYHDLRRDIHFLAGLLTLLPFLELPRKVQLKDQGESLLLEADNCMAEALALPTAGSVRRMRVVGEKILRFAQTVENGAKRHSQLHGRRA